MNQPSAPEERILCTADGVQLTAVHYRASVVRAHIVVAGATGVPQGFYRRFAEFCRAQGYHVLTLDYRGIGRSRPATLKGFRMDYLDWARQDLAAAIDAMATPGVPLYMIGTPSAAMPLACYRTTTRSMPSTPSPPAPAGTAGCRRSNACGYAYCGTCSAR